MDGNRNGIPPLNHTNEAKPAKPIAATAEIRNTDRREKPEDGGRRNEVLRPVPRSDPRGGITGERLRDLMRKTNMEGAEQVFAEMSHRDVEDAYNKLQLLVQDIRVGPFLFQVPALQAAERDAARLELRQVVPGCL